MMALHQYKVIPLTPDERPYLEQVQHLLDGHARDGWELVTAFRHEGAQAQAVDQMRQSLSQPSSTLFIFKRPA
jgi:hypothetical protein